MKPALAATLPSARGRCPSSPRRATSRPALLACLVAALSLAGIAPASAGVPTTTPPPQPFLRIEAGGHIGAVPALASDAAGTLLASVSFDKTIRLWSLPDGRPLATFRPPIGEREEGELYAVALTPDGSRLLAGGATCHNWDDGFCVYIFDVARRSLLGLLRNLPAPINALAVAPDGKRFAVGLARGGLRVFDAQSGAPLLTDDAYAGPVRAVAFDGQGNLFTAAADGHVRDYDGAGRKVADVAPEAGLKPWALTVSPNDGFVAVGFDAPDHQGHPRIDVLATGTLARAFSPDMRGLRADGILAVAWMADASGGSRLLAAGYLRDERGTLIRAWGDFGLGAPTDLAAATDTIRALVALPGLGAAFAAEDPGWGRIDTHLQVIARPTPPLMDLRATRETLAIAPDGSKLAFTTASGRWMFDVATASLTRDADTAGLRRPATTAAGLDVTNWRDTQSPALNGTRLKLEGNEYSRALTILPDGKVLLGTDNALRLFDGHGRQIASTPTPEPVVAVTSGDGIIAAALLDGTIRWYGADLSERAALFLHRDGQRWVLFTPDGRFDDSPAGGDSLVGVQLNRARNQMPDWLSFSQAFRVLYDPQAVRASIRGSRPIPSGAASELDDLRARLARQPIIDVVSACAPRPDGSCARVSIKTAGAPATVPAETKTLRLTLQLTDRGLGFGDLDSFVNGRNAGRTAPDGTSPAIDIPLDPGANVIQLRLYDHSGTVYSQSARLDVDSNDPVDRKGRLFIFAIGIDKYASPDLTLQFAVADAHSFIKAVSAAAAPLYSEIKVRSLTNEEATRSGILDAFASLARTIRPTDTFLFYVASHGARRETDGRFLLIPADESDLSSWAAIARGAIDEQTLIEALSRIQARDALLFLDTCHSGQMSASTLANVGHETGRYLLAASSPVQEALDSVDNHNGPLVYALREGLTGKAATNPDGSISALALGEYVSTRVSQLASERGHEQDAEFKAAQSELRSFLVGKISR